MIKFLLRVIFKISIFPLLVIVFLVLGNIYTYARLNNEKPIAHLTFTQINTQEFDATIHIDNFCDDKIYKLYGDQWRIDAQFLKWKSWAMLFGIDAMYRIERLSGRYSNVNDENLKQHIAHELKPKSTVDLSKLAVRYEGKFPPVDTAYGSSAYKNMAPNTLYSVYRTQSGILIREQSTSKAKPSNTCVREKSMWKKIILRMDQRLASILYSL